MYSVQDQLGNIIQFPSLPQRIISLVPSQTELLFDLGLDAQIVGITKFCTRSATKIIDKIKVGGTKNFDIELIKSLKPDLIIGNKEENEQAGIRHLQQLFPVWMSDIYNLSDALAMINRIGEIVEKKHLANTLVQQILQSFENLIPYASQKAAYFIWRKPYMVAARDTFIDDMMQKAGFQNVFGELKRYPEITAHDLLQTQPEVIFLSSEPYPFQEKHIVEIQTLCPQAQILLVDGEMFSWYGSRLKYSAAYFSSLPLKG